MRRHTAWKRGLEPVSKSFEERETFTPDSERGQTFERFVPAHFRRHTLAVGHHRIMARRERLAPRQPAFLH